MNLSHPNLRAWAGVWLALCPAIVWGQTLITNGSFELGTGQPGDAAYVSLGVGNTSITGWTVVTDELAWLHGSFTHVGNIGTVPSDGSYYLDLAGATDAAPHGGLQQSITTIPGQGYRLSFDLGTGTGASAGPVSLLATAGAISASFTNSNTIANWTTFGLDFTASSSSTMITLQGTFAPSGNWYIGLDNVSVVPVPEPSVVVLLAAGLLVVGGAVWRKTAASRRGRARVSASA